MATVLFEGVLTKEGSNIKNWKKRTVTVRSNGELEYFEKNAKKGGFNIKGKYFGDSQARNKQFLLAIAKTKRDFLYIHANSFTQRSAFKASLIKGGAIWISEKGNIPEQGIPEIAGKDIRDWDSKLLLQFLFKIHIGNNIMLGDVFGEAIEKSNLSGKELMETEHGKLSQISGIGDERDYDALVKCVRVLSYCRVYDEKLFLIFNKIHPFIERKDINNEFVVCMNNLGDVEQVKQQYLQLDKMQQVFWTPSFSGTNKFNSIITEMDEVLSREMKEVQKNIPDIPLEMYSKVFPIKLVLSEPILCDSGAMKKALSPKSNLVPNVTGTGLRSAIVVGPWFLEWTSSALCVPRRITAATHIISADIPSFEICRKIDIEELASIIAKVVVTWNTQMLEVDETYPKGRRVFEGNSQTFVEEVISQLNFNFTFSDEQKQFIEKMRAKGVCDYDIEISEEVKKKFNITNQKFESHSQLDIFTTKLLQQEPDFASHFSDTWVLLQRIDRLFWLRFLRAKAPENIPCENCPFQDPRSVVK